MRNKIIEMIELDNNNDFIIQQLYNIKNISKHDIIKNLSHVQKREVEFSNKAFHFQTQVEQIEHEKRDLQTKLERARSCVKCYECKDSSCINNIWFKM